ncbi:MAG TPA: HAD family hydrolase [Pseudonocardia sp.]|jgi:HAD superfamily hydrolase (TIGR01549 family)
MCPTPSDTEITPDVAVFDVDGTLVDTNYHHALAWFRAFRAYGVTLPVWRLHRAIGMGGDQLVASVAGDEVEDSIGDDVRARWSEEAGPLLAEVQPFEGAVELLREVRRRGFRVVLASSAKQEHLDRYLDLLDGGASAEAWTTSADVRETKPAPELLQAAVDKVGGGTPVMVGDSTWDFVASQRAGYVGYAVRTGGYSEQELREAGASAVFESLTALHDALDDTALKAAPGR